MILAVGHSARDTLAAALAAGAAGEARPIAIGARVEHPQGLIDRARYRLPSGGGRGQLPAASYRLAHNAPGQPSAFTFCMCPGGMIVPAHSEPGQVVVNGMSFAARRSAWANAAVVVQVAASAYGAADPLAGVRWQDGIERRAFELGAGRAPAQRVDDFLADRVPGELPRVSYPLGVVPADLREILPVGVVAGMKDALRAFDRELPGFASAEGVLVAPETRTTSPLRFLRTARGESATLPGLYPAGEGAGWAGGIASAALDGVRIADYLKTSA